MYKLCAYAMVETVEPFKLHTTSMSYIHKVFEHLQMLWMGIGLHTHTVTTTDVSSDSDVGELADNLGNVSMKSMPLCYG